MYQIAMGSATKVCEVFTLSALAMRGINVFSSRWRGFLVFSGVRLIMSGLAMVLTRILGQACL